CVGDRGLDLAAVADDPGVGEQPLDVGLAKARDALGIEPSKPMAESLALAQDRDPRETRLEPLETEALVQPALVAHRASPLLVVVGDVERIPRRPAADLLGHASDPRARADPPQSSQIVATNSFGNSECRVAAGLPS